jgi:hypothetical protein
MKHLLFAVIIVSMLAGAAPVFAQDQPPITASVQAGYDGAYRIAEWFPVDVNIANDGPDIRGVLEWRFPGQPGEPVFRREVDLPRGSRKRVSLAAYSRAFAQNGRLRLLVNEQPLLEQDVRLDALEPNRLLIGVSSSDRTLLNSLNSLRFVNVSETTVRHLDAAALPDSAAALRGLDVLVLHDVDSGMLRPEQRAAIALWVRLGGQLVLSGGLNGPRVLAGLAELAPVEGGATLREASLAPLAGLAGGVAPPGDMSVSVVQARPGAEGLPPQAPLIYRWRQGVGEVVFTTFDLAALRGWPGELPLWQGLIALNDTFMPGTSTRQQRTNLVQNVLRLPSLSLPSVLTLFVFLLVYIAAIGPLNYLLLRRLRRTELAWATIPLLVVIFASAFYFIGFGLRGADTQVSQLAIVQGFEGERRGFGTAFVSLFSTRRARYDLEFPPETVLSEARDWSDDDRTNVTTVGTDSGLRAPGVLVDVLSIRTFIAEAPAEVPLQVQSALRRENGALRGSIRNTGGAPLTDAMVVQGDTFWPLGTIAPGQTSELPTAAQRSFPSGVSLSRIGYFNREQMLASLMDSTTARFRGTSPGRRGSESAYLLAWATEPATSLQLNGQPATQDALTLYVIRLNV